MKIIATVLTAIILLSTTAFKVPFETQAETTTSLSTYSKFVFPTQPVVSGLTSDDMTWTVEKVNKDGDGGLDNSIAVDSAGNPLIAYFGYSFMYNNNLTYAWKNDVWNLQVVQVIRGSCPSLALDSKNNPHIVYYGADYTVTQKPLYSRKIDNQWIHEEFCDKYAKIFSMALDNQDRPCVAYFDDSPQGHHLKYAFKDDTEWNIEVVDTVIPWTLLEMVLDSKGYPHVVYSDISASNILVKYAFKDSSGWHTEIVKEDLPSYESIDVDAFQRPHIVYINNDRDLIYAFKDSAGWKFETIDNSGLVDSGCSIKLDRDSVPHVAYIRVLIQDELKCARRISGQWDKVTVFTTDYSSDFYHCHLALDYQGNVHISFYYLERLTLMYAFGARTIPQPSYPSDRWERLWFVCDSSYAFTDFLGVGPDETNLDFDTDWGGSILAYGRENHIGFISSRTVNCGGTWKFTVGSDDGCRLYIDDQLVIDEWHWQMYTTYEYETTLSSGNHMIKFNYFENDGAARVSFKMESNHFVLIDIEIESTREKLEHLQTESEITSRVRNQGNYVARDVSVTIELPYNFISQDATSWSGQINLGEEKVMTTKISATRCVDGTINVKVQYKDQNGDVKNELQSYTLPVRELIVLEHVGEWTDVNLSPQSVQKAKTWTGAENLAAGMWLDALIKDLGLDELTATKMLSYADRLKTWIQELWNEGKVDPEVLSFLADSVASVSLNTVTLYIAAHQPKRLLEDGTMNYHGIWLTKTTYEILNLLKDMYLQMIEWVIRKPTNYNSIKIDDPQGKLYMQVFADGRELNTYYIDDIAFAVIDANATTIRYIVDATDAEYSTEQYDMTFVSVRSGEVIEQRTMIETIDKNEHQESIIEITPSGSIGSIARSFDVIADGKLFTVEVLSDSTVWNFGFDKYNKQVMFDFRIERSTGFCNVTIPKELLRENAAQPWQIRLDGSEIPFTSKENEAYSFLHFETSSGGTYTVQIFGAEAIPEFSNVWILLLMVTTLLSTTVLLRRSWVRARKRLV